MASMSFLAFSSAHSQRTLWIDDVLFQQRIANPTFVYKGRVLPSDLVEFEFIEELKGPGQSVAKLPVLSYPPPIDIFSLAATTLAAIYALAFLSHRSPFIVRSRSLRSYLRRWLTLRNKG
jgi:hypothetical protein